MGIGETHNACFPCSSAKHLIRNRMLFMHTCGMTTGACVGETLCFRYRRYVRAPGRKWVSLGGATRLLLHQGYIFFAFFTTQGSVSSSSTLIDNLANIKDTKARGLLNVHAAGSTSVPGTKVGS